MSTESTSRFGVKVPIHSAEEPYKKDGTTRNPVDIFASIEQNNQQRYKAVTFISVGQLACLKNAAVIGGNEG